jgi:lantibiotic modifying enzyme
LATTQRWLEDALSNGDESACLCHGLAGNADILLDGYASLGDHRLHDTAVMVANAGIDRYAGDPYRWPCGTYNGSTPGLMLGLAGIGRFYLRLADPTLPSVLLPVAPVDA